VLSVRRDVLLEALDDSLVLKQEDGAAGRRGNVRARARSGRRRASSHAPVRILEAVEALLGRRPVLGGHDGLDVLLGDRPHLVVVGAERDDDPGRLRVERRRAMLDGKVDELDDAVVADRRRLGERVDGAARLDGVEERRRVGGAGGGSGVGGGHCAARRTRAGQWSCSSRRRRASVLTRCGRVGEDGERSGPRREAEGLERCGRKQEEQAWCDKSVKSSCKLAELRERAALSATVSQAKRGSSAAARCKRAEADECFR